MRPLPQTRETKTAKRNSPVAQVLPALVLLAMGAWTLGCGGGGAGSVAPPPPPPSSISVSVTPTSGSVLLGNSLNFTASVSGTGNTAVTWSVNGIAGGSTQTGTISTSGAYTAPVDLPASGTVQVTATSQADSTKSSTASVTITSDISISLSPNASSVELGAKQSFQAAIQSQGHPDPTIRWSLSGSACPNACGAVDSNGNYIAPQILPSSTLINLIATSAADPSKQSTASITVTSHFTLQLSAPSQVVAGASSSLVAILTPVAGSNPSTAMNWTVSGSGCVRSACGLLTSTTSELAGGTPLENTAVYTAPSTAPVPNTVIITVTPIADPTKQVQASITIEGNAGISLSPAAATLVVNGRITLTAAQSGTSTGGFSWNVNGVPGGTAAYGMICVTGSNPCQPFVSGSATQADYVAPAAIPPSNPFAITVSSTTNPNLSTSAEITLINHVVVSVQPSSATLPPLGTQSFTAAVLGTTNQDVVWQVQGTGCAVAGSCGTVDVNGNYTAPGIPPSPDAMQVVAISQYDTTQSGSANVTVSTQLAILGLLPASVYEGGQDGFTLQVTGSGFVPSSPGPGLALLIGGTARVTTCASAGVCTAPVTSADVAQSGNLNIQVQNPGGAVSNLAELAVVAPTTTPAVISLSSASPSATGMNITVVQPTTAGVDTTDDNVDLNVAALGAFNTANNSCSLGGNAIPLVRPSSGTTTVSICVFSNSGLDATMTYTVSGPGDVAVIAQQPAGLGIIALTLQLPASATPGPRTLFIQDNNLDKTSASGVLEIQ
jgi:hypothetical protein